MAANAVGAVIPETRLQFVSEFIRELGAVERIRARSATELKNARDAQERMSTCIANATSMQLERQSQTHMMRAPHLNPPLEFLPQDIAKDYDFKIELYGSMSRICSEFSGGPRPNVDYQELMNEMPKIRAKLDYVDHLICQTSILVFAALIVSVRQSNVDIRRATESVSARGEFVSASAAQDAVYHCSVRRREGTAPKATPEWPSLANL